MDIEILRSELANDPLGRGYASMEDGAVAASINQPNRSSSRSMTAQELHAWFVFNGKWPSIVSTAAATAGGTGPTASQKLAAESFIEICHYFSHLNMREAQYANGILFVLEQFVGRAIITTTQKDEIIGLSAVMISRADELGLGYVQHTDVAVARNV